MIVLKFQENMQGQWSYIPNFIKSDYSIEKGDSIDFWACKLSKQPLGDIIKFAEYIKKFEDFTLHVHTDCNNSINAKKLIEIADEVYVEGKLIKSKDIKETKMSKNIGMDMELRIPEDQMQRLEAIAVNIQKSVGPKTWKKKILDVLFGRVAIITMIGAYWWMGGENPEVVNYDRANGVISVKNGDQIENLIWNGEQLSQNGKVLDTEFSRKISNSIMLGLDILGLENDSNWF